MRHALREQGSDTLWGLIGLDPDMPISAMAPTGQSIRETMERGGGFWHDFDGDNVNFTVLGPDGEEHSITIENNSGVGGLALAHMSPVLDQLDRGQQRGLAR